MGKLVRMVAEILPEACTGCSLCVYVCPTVALEMHPRPAEQPGPGRKLAVLNEGACYNSQNCLEICPDEAIVMHPLDEPFEVGVDRSGVDESEIANLCLLAGLMPEMRVCFCTETTAGELAAAIILGADSPEKLALMTGARTGCTEICQQPTLRLLAVAGHGDAPYNPPRGFQWYGLTGRLLDLVDDRMELPDGLVDRYRQFPLRRDLNATLGNLSEA